MIFEPPRPFDVASRLPETAAARPAEIRGDGAVEADEVRQAAGAVMAWAMTAGDAIAVSPLPFSASYMEAGELDSLRPSRTFSVPIGPETASVRIKLDHPEPGRPLMIEMTVLDGDGGIWTTVRPAPGASSVWLGWTPTFVGPVEQPRVVFVRISLLKGAPGSWDPADPDPSATSGPASPSDSTFAGSYPAPDGRFLLEVEQTLAQPRASEPDAAYFDPKPSTVGQEAVARESSASSSPPAWLPVASPSESRPMARSKARAPGIATGPLPSMAAGPQGGSLASERPDPVADPHDPAAVDLLLSTLSTRTFRDEGASDEGRPAADPAAPGRPAPAVVMIGRPGGLPLYGTAVATLPDEGGRALPLLADLARNAPPVLDPVAGTVVVDGANAGRAGERDSGGRSRLLRRVTITSAVSVAMLSMLGLHLPGVVDPRERTRRRRAMGLAARVLGRG